MLANGLTTRLAILQTESQHAKAEQAEVDIDEAHEDYKEAVVQQQQAEAALESARRAAANAGWWEKTFGKIADVAGLVEAVATATSMVDPTAISRGVATVANGVECGAKVGKSVAAMAGADDQYDADRATIKSKDAGYKQERADLASSEAIDDLQASEQNHAQAMRVVRQMSAKEHEFTNEMMMRVRG